MTTQEQELTFKNIDEFFSIAEEIVDVISNSIDDLDQAEIMHRLNIVESFIEQMLSHSEIITDDYTRLINCDARVDPCVREEIKQQIVLMIIALNDCKEQLLERLDNE